jgi:hypothetical protein
MSQNLVVASTTDAPTLGERCDRCGATAKVVVQLSEGRGDLAFCGHHANRLRHPIASEAASVVVQAGFEWHGIES